MALGWLGHASADLIGSVAGTLTTVAFLPQVVKTIRTRSTRDISLAMWLSFTMGVALWLVYGLVTESIPILAANAVTLVLSGTVLAVKIGNLRKD